MKVLGYLLDIIFTMALAFICWQCFEASTPQQQASPVKVELPAQAAWEANTGDWEGWRKG